MRVLIVIWYLSTKFTTVVVVNEVQAAAPPARLRTKPTTATSIFPDLVTVVTVATDVSNLGYKRFLLSAKAFGINVTNIGEGKHWNHFGTKILLYRDFLSKLNTGRKKRREHIILIVDSYDVIFLAGLDEIVKRFKRFPGTRVLFAAEHYCAPVQKLQKRYRKRDKTVYVYPYLNSGGIIGYLPEVKKIMKYKTQVDNHNDQLYLTQIYLNEKLRKTYRMSLDRSATIFLNWAINPNQINVLSTNNGYVVEDAATKQRPAVLHAPGPTGKTMLTYLYETELNKQFEQ